MSSQDKLYNILVGVWSFISCCLHSHDLIPGECNALIFYVALNSSWEETAFSDPQGNHVCKQSTKKSVHKGTESHSERKIILSVNEMSP